MDNPTLCSEFQSLEELFTVTEYIVSDLEVFVCKLCGQQEYSNVNDAKHAMFSLATMAENVLSPNWDTSHKHIQKANVQAIIYKRSLEQHQDIPPPVWQGWKLINDAVDTLGIDWMQIQSAQKSTLEHSSCACKKCKYTVGEGDDKG